VPRSAMPSSMQPTNLFVIFARKLNQIQAQYMITGSTAVLLYGMHRMTAVVDMVVLLDAAQLARLPELFPLEEFYCPPIEVIRREAARSQRGHINIIHHETGFKADFYLSGRDPLNQWGFARARKLDVEGEPVFVSPPELVIVKKLEFYREGGSMKHVQDIQFLLQACPDLDVKALDEKIQERGLESTWQEVRNTKI